MGQKAIISFR